VQAVFFETLAKRGNAIPPFHWRMKAYREAYPKWKSCFAGQMLSSWPYRMQSFNQPVSAKPVIMLQGPG